MSAISGRLMGVPWMLFDASGHDPDKLRQTIEQDRRAMSPARPLVCSNCEHPISTEEQRIEISGAHSHTCTNPHGIIFQIGCFSRAPGCAPVGPPSMEYTWFPGCNWQVAVCGNCHIHIGWLFRGEDRFYGLILTRLKTGAD
jgi:hypothetical protein